MYCPILNPSGGDYDPLKEQYKIKTIVMRQETRHGFVTSSSSEKVPIVRKPFTMPEFMPEDAPSVVQLDNTRKITNDFAAITISAGTEAKRTYIFNAKLLASNSPARQISTALMYVTEERLYNRFERFAKQNRNNSGWMTAQTYASVDVMRCHDEGKFHTPPSPGPTSSKHMWEIMAESQAVSTEFVYLTGFKDKPAALTEDYLFSYIEDEINREVKQSNLTLAERQLLIIDKINKVNNTMFLDRRENAKLAANYNDVIIHPLDLLTTPITWVGDNRVDLSFVNKENTNDLKDWFMQHEQFHLANKQFYVDNGFNLAEFRTDGSIYIKSNIRMDKSFIAAEKSFVESNNEGVVYTDW